MAALGEFDPEWVLVSSGFDAHAHDPLAELRLTEPDYASMSRLLRDLVPANRVVVFLEGGYHLPAIRDSVTAVVRALMDEPVDLEPSQYTSPDESHRSLARVIGQLRGRVVGLD